MRLKRSKIRAGTALGHRFHINQDLLAGLMFAAFGVAGLWFGREYPMGTPLRMGPGYMPWLLCWGLVLFGAAIAIKGAAVEGQRLTRWHLRPLILVTSALIAFAFLLESAGLVVATAALVVLGALGGVEWRPVETMALAVGLAAAAVGLFVYGLKLPLPVWPV